jgi:hypothetical protein|tara:strand:+ start:264 stop:413 length:150 start_codon:yes stop_codon:yes gene_type:complete
LNYNKDYSTNPKKTNLVADTNKTVAGNTRGYAFLKNSVTDSIEIDYNIF